jgi:hypothetical protein
MTLVEPTLFISLTFVSGGYIEANNRVAGDPSRTDNCQNDAFSAGIKASL